MQLYEMRHNNAVEVYRAVLNGDNTHSKISKSIGISRLTVCEITNEFVKRDILDIAKPKQDKRGRRTHIFKPSHKYYSIFIDKQERYFSTIGISTNGEATIRFDYPVNYEKRTSDQVLNELVIPRVKNHPSFKYCMAIYLLGNDLDELTVSEDVIKISKEDMIAQALADENKIRVFDFNGKYIVSLYSHIYYPTVSLEALCNALPVDEVLTYRGDLYYECFDALTFVTKNNLEDMI